MLIQLGNIQLTSIFFLLRKKSPHFHSIIEILRKFISIMIFCYLIPIVKGSPNNNFHRLYVAKNAKKLFKSYFGKKKNLCGFLLYDLLKISSADSQNKKKVIIQSKFVGNIKSYKTPDISILEVIK